MPQHSYRGQLSQVQRFQHPQPTSARGAMQCKYQVLLFCLRSELVSVRIYSLSPKSTESSDAELKVLDQQLLKFIK